MLEELRKIGKRIYSEIATYRYAFLVEDRQKQKPPRGASGDRTYPVDKKAEEIILEGLESLKEPLSIVSEEYGLKDIKGGGKKVLIDPIDGSKNAITGIPFYCTSIAIAEGNMIGSVTTAYVINLLTGDEFYAEKGRGAFMNGHQLKTQRDGEIYLVAYEAQTPKRDLPVILHLLSSARRTRCLGATALDLALLAQGSISIFISPAPSRSFDFAAGWLLVKEAGGIFTDIEGKLLDNTPLGLEKTTTLLASGNDELHKRALKLLREGKQ